MRLIGPTVGAASHQASPGRGSTLLTVRERGRREPRPYGSVGMSRMQSVTVREFCREFSRKVEAPLRRGETLIHRKRKEILGRIVPERAEAREYPDFAARQKKIFGDRVINFNFAEFLREQRNRF